MRTFRVLTPWVRGPEILQPKSVPSRRVAFPINCERFACGGTVARILEALLSSNHALYICSTVVKSTISKFCAQLVFGKSWLSFFEPSLLKSLLSTGRHYILYRKALGTALVSTSPNVFSRRLLKSGSLDDPLSLAATRFEALQEEALPNPLPHCWEQWNYLLSISDLLRFHYPQSASR
jgi:hypothetical protein